MNEYAILQEKIDKIGGFRFIIKGWAITLDTGALVAVFASSLQKTPALLLLLGLHAAMSFLEYLQLDLSDKYQDRALRIEKVIDRRLQHHGLRRADLGSLMRIPGIAGELRARIDVRRPMRTVSHSLSRHGALLTWVLRLPLVRAVRRLPLRRKLVRSHLIFYVVLLVLSAAFVYFQHPRAADTPTAPQGQVLRTSVFQPPKAAELQRERWHVKEK